MNGKSDINPQWRVQALTEEFGPCGVGWKFVVTERWTQPAGQELLCFVNVSLFIKIGEAWSDAIPGSGGNKLIEAESKGLHNSDEGWKMATTDALGNAAKYLGLAAEIYLGNWDGSKYRDTPDKPKASATPAKPANDREILLAPWLKKINGVHDLETLEAFRVATVKKRPPESILADVRAAFFARKQELTEAAVAPWDREPGQEG